MGGLPAALRPHAKIHKSPELGRLQVEAGAIGLTTATVSWLGWQGFLFTALGVPLDSDLAGTDGGVLVALLLGILLPIVIGIPAIRKQEETRVP